MPFISIIFRYEIHMFIYQNIATTTGLCYQLDKKKFYILIYIYIYSIYVNGVLQLGQMYINYRYTLRSTLSTIELMSLLYSSN